MSVHRSMMLASGLVAAAALPAGVRAADIAVAPVAGTLLDVDVQGEVSRTPDLATVTAGVVSQAPTAAGALADTARRMAAATAALRQAGIADRDIRTASLTLQPQYRYADNQPPAITGYQASNQLTVRFRDPARAGAILDALVAQGVNQIGGPDFGVEHPDAALDEARTSAIAKARAEADLYARATGLRIVRIVALTESGGTSSPGPMRPMRPMFAVSARAEKASTDLQPGEEKIVVGLHVTFELR